MKNPIIQTTKKVKNVPKDSVQNLTKCQVLDGGMLSQKRSFCVQRTLKKRLSIVFLEAGKERNEVSPCQEL